PVLNKMGGMLAHPAIKRVLIENPDEVYLRKAMDERAIVLVNISKGHLGEDASHILGGMFFSSLNSAAFSRASQLEEERVPFIVYADEFHTYVCDSVINMLSELRKFRVGLVLANQYMYQLDEDVRRAVFGNVGTLISFRVGMDDARHLANEMYPVFNADDFIGLPNYSVYLKLMVDGCPSRPFSAETIAN
ncbi:MAG: type IV secretory system conjugative DNA transfer family protein, partial [Bacteroidetes bacterium]|nr:type IV secretory system conjugative DNA transfer family protein [Bacteroidota bacterium]